MADSRFPFRILAKGLRFTSYLGIALACLLFSFAFGQEKAQASTQVISLQFYLPTTNIQVTLPIDHANGGNPWTVSIQWGSEGTVTNLTSASPAASFGHQFTGSGNETIIVTSTAGAMVQFGNGAATWAGEGYLTGVNSFGTSLTSLTGAFYGATTSFTVPTSIPTGITDFSYAFANANAFNDPNISSWAPSASGVSAINMSYMFQNALVFNQNISGWDTHTVTNMSYMFSGATAFNNGGVAFNSTGTGGASWDLQKVTNATYMFQNDTGLDNGTTISMTNWNIGATTSNAASLSYMFTGASNFNSNISTWDTHTVINTSYMFSGAAKFNNGGQSLAAGNATALVPANAWDLEKVQTFTYMFQNDTGLDNGTNIAVSNWQMGTTAASAPTLTYMFSGATNFNSDIHTWNTKTVTDMSFMFSGDTSFDNNGQSLNSSGTGGSTWDLENVKTFASMFAGDTGLDNATYGGVISMTGWNPGASVTPTAAVPTLLNMFNGATNFDSDLSTWNTSAVVNMSYMFSGTIFNNHSVNNLSSWDVRNVQNFSYMFNNDTHINIPMAGWNLGTFWNGVVTTDHMFFGATAFNQDISSWVTNTVINMSYMFDGDTNFNQNIATGTINVNQWNVGNVTTMQDMFYNDTYFNWNISNWNTGKVTTMQQMFYGAAATNMNQNLGNWNVTSISGAGLTQFESGFHVLNYSLTLQGWSGQVVKSGVTLSVMSTNYNDYNLAGQAARLVLTSTPYNWNISGDTSYAVTNALTVNNATPPIGATITFTATVNETTGAFADGNYYNSAYVAYPIATNVASMWTISGTAGVTSCKTGSLLGTIGLSATQSTYTCSITVTNGGTYTAKFIYPGDSNFIASTAAPNPQTATAPRSTPTVLVYASPGNQSTLGSTLTYVATVTGIANAATPSASMPIASTSASAGLATFTLAANAGLDSTAGLSVGQQIVVTNGGVYNGTYTIFSIPSTTTFTFQTGATGSVVGAIVTPSLWTSVGTGGLGKTCTPGTTT